MSDYAADISKHTSAVNESAVTSIVTYCGIALRNVDSSLVAATDPTEMATIRAGLAAKKRAL